MEPAAVDAGYVRGPNRTLWPQTKPPGAWPPREHLSAVQRDGKPLGAAIDYRGTWRWLDARGCPQFVHPRLIGAYTQAFARGVQCEEAISKFGLLGKHPRLGRQSRPRHCASRTPSPSSTTQPANLYRPSPRNSTLLAPQPPEADRHLALLRRRGTHHPPTAHQTQQNGYALDSPREFNAYPKGICGDAGN